jgi:hypothetical protein
MVLNLLSGVSVLDLRTLITYKRKRLKHSFMTDNRYYLVKYSNDLGHETFECLSLIRNLTFLQVVNKTQPKIFNLILLLMFRNKTLLATITFICISGICIAQHINSNVIQPTEASIEQKLASAVWRTDVYICTGIAYAKRNGKTVEDFTEFVGNLHTLGSDFNSVLKTLYYVPTTYPKGKVEIL